MAYDTLRRAATTSNPMPLEVTRSFSGLRALKDTWVWRCLNDYRRGCYKKGFPSHIDLNEVWDELARSKSGPNLNRHPLWKNLQDDINHIETWRRPEDRSWLKTKSRGTLPGFCRPAVIFALKALNHAETGVDAVPGLVQRALMALKLEDILEDPATCALDSFWDGADFYNRQWIGRYCTWGRGWCRSYKPPSININLLLRYDYLQAKMEKKTGKRDRSGVYKGSVSSIETSSGSSLTDYDETAMGSSTEKLADSEGYGYGGREILVDEAGDTFEDFETYSDYGLGMQREHTGHSTGNTAINMLQREVSDMKSALENIVGGEDDELVASVKKIQAQIDRTDKNLRTQIDRMDTRLEHIVSRLCHLESVVSADCVEISNPNRRLVAPDGNDRHTERLGDTHTEVSDLSEAKALIEKLERELREARVGTFERQFKREMSQPAPGVLQFQPPYQQYHPQPVYGYPTPYSPPNTYPPQSYPLPAPPSQTGQHIRPPFTATCMPAPQVWPWMAQPGPQAQASGEVSMPPLRPTRVKLEDPHREQRKELRAYRAEEDD